MNTRRALADSDLTFAKKERGGGGITRWGVECKRIELSGVYAGARSLTVVYAILTAKLARYICNYTLVIFKQRYRVGSDSGKSDNCHSSAEFVRGRALVATCIDFSDRLTPGAFIIISSITLPHERVREWEI